MQNTNLICPSCGAHFALPEHEHLAAGMAIGKDSGLGDIHMPLDGEHSRSPLPGKARQRLEALKAAGIDTTGLLALESAAGDGRGQLVRMDENGTLHTLTDDDPLFHDPDYIRIFTGEHIQNTKTYRRWIMAQVFYMMQSGENQFIPNLRKKGYRYMWKMTLEEMRVQAILAINDTENFQARNRWFNKKLILKMTQHYMDQLTELVNARRPKGHKNAAYKQIFGKKYLLSDLPAFYAPITRAIFKIEKAGSPKALYLALESFLNVAQYQSSWTMCPAWIDAYQGTGAYYTLQNMILFHNCILKAKKATDKRSSMKELEEAAKTYCEENPKNGKTQGWRLFGLMKKTIHDNGIDINEKRQEWRKARQQKKNLPN